MSEQLNKPSNRLLGIGIFAAATLGFFLYAKNNPLKNKLPIIYPPESTPKGKGRIFQTIHTPQEFDLLLSSPESSHGTLFATFVRLGEVPSNSMATNMWEIIRNVDTPNTATVCVELTGGRNDELMRRYVVNKIPSVVALKKTLPYDVYVDEKVQNSDTNINEVNTENLKLWVESVLSK